MEFFSIFGLFLMVLAIVIFIGMVIMFTQDDEEDGVTLAWIVSSVILALNVTYTIAVQNGWI